MSGSFLKQSTASQSRAIGPFLDDTDFKTAETGLTIANTDIKLVVNGGASANKNSGGGTHRVNGVYGVTFDATDTATVGEMQVSVVVAGALPVFHTFFVLEEAVYDALFAASAPGYLQPTTAGRTLDVSAGGEAGIDWANVGSPTTVVGLTGTTVKTATDVETDTADIQSRLPAALVSGRIDASVGAMAANVVTATAIAADAITAAKIADGAIDAATFAAGAIDAAAIAANAIGASELAADAVAEIADAVWDEATTGHTTSGTFGEQCKTDIDEILTDTGTTLQGEVDGIQADTEDIQARLPAALTGGGNMKVDVLAISGSTTAADKLERAADSEVLGTCNSGSTTTSIVASSLSPATAVNDQLNGRIMIFAADTTTAALRGQATDITDYVHGTLTFTVTALTTAPASGDTFTIV